eukprot:TRINITY_DN10011_c0_g1_i1.p1 TRINITY_DN10011_c0_g1~~TRINITY_DN10011_c0_g1_i1.p1  ORF type:complete len:308 (+),score=26.84 TRINITY_DN10011_c0_g1_i1:306-1229(+)
MQAAGQSTEREQPAFRPLRFLSASLMGFDQSRTLKDLFAGSIAGMTSLALCYPMDTIRTRLQATDRFNSISDALRQTFRNEGAAGFYKGLASPLLAQAVQKSIMFGAYGTAKRFIQVEGTTPHMWQLFACGAFAGSANTIVATPVELVRNRLMVQYNKAETRYSGPVDCIKQIVRQEGLAGMWRGMWPTLCRDSIGVGAYYATFEWARRALTKQGEAPSIWILMASGAMAGIGYWVTAFPQDTIKSVIQTEKTQAHRAGMLDTGVRLVKQHGWRRLYRGFLLGVSRGIPGAAAVFTTHSLVFNALGG